MKSIAKAINNLANSITKLADSKKILLVFIIPPVGEDISMAIRDRLKRITSE